MRWACFLLLAVCASHADVLEQAVQEYLEPGMVITNAVQMPLQNGSSVYILPIDGQETLVIGSWSPKAIENEGELLAILQDGLKKQANSAGAKAELLAIVARSRETKAVPEAQCAQYTGTEDQQCIDKDTCNAAAQSSPQAQVMVQADGFWQDMRGWYVKKEEMNLLLSELAAMANSSAESQQFAVDVSLKIRSAYVKWQELDANNLMRPGIYGIGSYCPPVAWPYTDMLKAEGRWKGIAATLSSLSAQDARAHDIALRTRAWLDYISTRASEFLRMERGMDGRLLAISQKLLVWNSSFSDDAGLAAKYRALENEAKNATAAGNAGRYRAALEAEDGLIARADGIESRIEADFGLANATGQRLANAKKAAGVLRGMGQEAQAGAIEADAKVVEGQLAGKPRASALPGISLQAKQLESTALEAVAAATLGIERENGTRALGQNAIPAAATGQNATLPPIPQPPSCALPFAIGAGGVGLAFYAGRKK